MQEQSIFAKAKIDPVKNPDKALIYLIREYIKNQSINIKTAIVKLNPSMRNWDLSHFVNFLGKNDATEYSIDSDDDQNEVDEPKYQSASTQSISSTILNSLGTEFKKDDLQARALNALNKNPISTHMLTKSAEQRRDYLPPVNTNSSPAETKLLAQEVKWLNKAVIEINADKKDSASIRPYKEQNQTTTNGKKPTYVVSLSDGNQHELTFDYLLPLIRGVSYLVDRWGKDARKAHRELPLNEEFIHYPETVIKPLNFYQLQNYLGIDRDTLQANAEHLKSELLSLRKSGKIIFKNKKFKDGKEFDNFLDYLQYAFSNGIDHFLEHIEFLNEQNQHLRHRFPQSGGNPFLPFSKLPFHAFRYAFAAKDPYEEFVVDPLYDNTGKPRKPHVGSAYVALFPLKDFLGFDEPNDVCWLSKNYGVNPKSTIGPENEVSFLGFVEKNRIVKKIKVRYPGFHHDLEKNSKMRAKYLVKYGLSLKLYKCLAEKIKNPATRPNAILFLREWLALYNSIKLMHELKADLNPHQKILFRDQHGLFLSDNYPPESNFIDTEINELAEEFARAHLSSPSIPKTPLVTKEQGKRGYTDGRELIEINDQSPARRSLSGESPDRISVTHTPNEAKPYLTLSPPTSPDKKPAVLPFRNTLVADTINQALFPPDAKKQTETDLPKIPDGKREDTFLKK